MSAIMGLAAVACISRDDFDVEGKVNYRPIYSVPLGTMNITADAFIPTLGLIEADTLNLLDTLPNLIVDSIPFLNPVVLDTTIIVPFDIHDLLNDLDHLQAITLRFNFTNGLPAKIILQPYFAVSMNNIMEEVFPDGPVTIDAAPVDAEGNVRGVSQSLDNDRYLSRDDIYRIHLTQFLVIPIQLYTGETLAPIKLDSDYTFQIQAALRLELAFDTLSFP